MEHTWHGWKIIHNLIVATSGLDGDVHFWSIIDAKYINSFEGKIFWTPILTLLVAKLLYER